MLSELIEKLEREHGISTAQSHGILNTIAQHIKEKFPMVGGMIDNIFGSDAASPSTNNTDIQDTNASASETTSEKMEDLVKSKLGGFFEGNKL